MGKDRDGIGMGWGQDRDKMETDGMEWGDGRMGREGMGWDGTGCGRGVDKMWQGRGWNGLGQDGMWGCSRTGYRAEQDMGWDGNRTEHGMG